MASKVEHKVRGEHMVDGMVFPDHITQETIDKVKAFQYRPDDLLTVTYAKCGKLKVFSFFNYWCCLW